MLNFVVLGLLGEKTRHGYELRQAVESLFGGTWPLNIGQIYRTLARLERDGLIESTVVEQETLPDRKVYALTSAGWDELLRWLSQPVAGTVPVKQELFAKILVHVLLDAGDPTQLIWSQRKQLLETLGELNRVRAGPAIEAVTALLLDGAIVHIEADLRWLDTCEAQLGAIKHPRP